MENQEHKDTIKLLIVIVGRGLGEQVNRLLRKSQVTFNMVCPGHGASGTEIKDYLGITSEEKDIVLSVIAADKVQSVLDKLNAKFNMDQPDMGLALTIPISGVSGPLALRYMLNLWEEEPHKK